MGSRPKPTETSTHNSKTTVMKLLASTLSISLVTANHQTSSSIAAANLDTTISCAAKTDMAGFECCSGYAFYNCLPTSVSGNACNCNSNCASFGDCCDNQVSF